MLTALAGAGLATGVAGAGRAVAGDAALGQYLAGECVTCHRTDGASEGIPGIVGLPTDQFVGAMTAYRNKTRENPVMRTIAGQLNDAEIAALAAYFSGLDKNR